MVLIIEVLIRAVKFGAWRAYISATKRMIPYSILRNSFDTLKSDQLFIQVLQKLGSSQVMDTFEKFSQDLFFIKRSDKYFCVISTDTMIEQSLMKSSKFPGNFVNGRNTKVNVLRNFISLESQINIFEQLYKFWVVYFENIA